MAKKVVIVVGAWTSIKNGVVYFEPVQSQKEVYFAFLLVFLLVLVVLCQKHDLNSYFMVYDRPCKISIASAVYQGADSLNVSLLMLRSRLNEKCQDEQRNKKPES